jgi:hypothetical protein
LVIGVVSDTLGEASLTAGLPPLASEAAIYRPAAQIEDARLLATVHGWFQPSWIVRTAGPIENLTGQMQRALADADPNLPFSGFHSMTDLMPVALTTQRVQVALLTAMASLALLRSGRVRCPDHPRRRADAVSRHARGRHHAHAASGTDRPRQDAPA